MTMKLQAVPPSPNFTRTLEMERESSYQVAKQDLVRPHPATPTMATIRIQQRVYRMTRNINKVKESNRDLVALVLGALRGPCWEQGEQEHEEPS